MKNQHHNQGEASPCFSGAVAANVSDEDLFVSQRNNIALFTALSSVVTSLEGTYTCFGVMFSVLTAHDDAHSGLETFVQIHKVKPETGLLRRLEPECRFLLRDMLHPTMREIDLPTDNGLKALCHHFHCQPLFIKMLEVKAARETKSPQNMSSSARRAS